MSRSTKNEWVGSVVRCLSVLGACLLAACSSGGGGSGPVGDAGPSDATDASTETPGDTTSNPGITIAGTVTLPADATGRCAMIAIDDNTSGSDSSARRPDGSYLLVHQKVTGKSIAFSIERVPNGTYYLWAYVDVDSSSSSPAGDCEIKGAPNRGDHLGYFDTELSPPATPNVTVPHRGTARFDFRLGAFPQIGARRESSTCAGSL